MKSSSLASHLRNIDLLPVSSSLPKACRLNRRNHSTIALGSPVSIDALEKARPFKEVPGPSPLPFLGNIHRYLPGIGEYSKAYWHEAQKTKFYQYGRIVREEIVPGFSMVHLYDPNDMETVSRHEGKFPKRDFFVGMKTLREQKPDLYHTVGVAPGNGEAWYQIRSKSQKVMMRPQIMKTYLPQMNVIADDVIERIRKIRSAEKKVPMLMNEFFKWALESVCYILFLQRMGCLDDNLSPDSRAQTYIQAVNDFFRCSAKVELASIPVWRVAPSLSPAFRKLKKVHNFFFESAMEYVKDATAKLEQEMNEDRDSSLMEMLLRFCSPQDACVMAIDSMAAGIDTTSLSMAYVLRNLAANPEAQSRLQEEVDRVLPNHAPLTTQTLQQMPYLRACIKESMRISPTVQGTSRTLDQDIVLSGYRIPANTLMTLNYYVSSVQEISFPEPLKYIPERWIKGASKFSTSESFAFQPFGFGPRMCIGRRIADLEMYTLLTKMIQNFWIENKSHEIDINFQLVLMIKSPLQYEFHDRE